jgi:putative copper export protein
MNEHLLDGALVRGTAYVALALTLGPVVWALLVDRIRSVTLERWRIIGAAVSLVTVIVLSVYQATATFAGRWSITDAFDVLCTTSYGHMLAIFVASTIAHIAVIARRRQRIAISELTTGIAVIVTLTLLGHAALDSWWLAGVQILHSAAAVIWLGGLVVAILRTGNKTVSVGELLRFGRVALGLVVVIVATGIARTAMFLHNGVSAPVWTTVLVVKLTLVALALLIAWRHRRTAFCGLGIDPSSRAWRRMHTMLTLETWLVSCAILMAGLLSQVPPP